MATVPRWSWFEDAWWPKRFVALVALLAASAAVLKALAHFTRFPPDFNAAQSSSARELMRNPDRWRVWSDTAKRDLMPFTPAYVSWGVAAIAWATWPRRFSALACGFMLATGAVDVFETVMFRGTLDRLVHGATEEEVSTLTTVTAVATKVKLTCAVLAVGLLVVSVLRPSTP